MGQQWVYPDIVKDERWESSKPKLKGKSCNIISLITDEDTATIASLSDSREEEKLALTTQPNISQPVGTRSGKSYSKQSTKHLWNTTSHYIRSYYIGPSFFPGSYTSYTEG